MWADGALDGVCADLDAAVGQKQGQPASVFGDVFEGLAERGLYGDAGAVGGEPDFKIVEDGL